VDSALCVKQGGIGSSPMRELKLKQNKMKEINLMFETIIVQTKAIKTKFRLVKGKPIFDIHPDAAKALGTTRKKWIRMMNK